MARLGTLLPCFTSSFCGWTRPSLFSLAAALLASPWATFLISSFSCQLMSIFEVFTPNDPELPSLQAWNQECCTRQKTLRYCHWRPIFFGTYAALIAVKSGNACVHAPEPPELVYDPGTKTSEQVGRRRRSSTLRRRICDFLLFKMSVCHLTPADYYVK